MDGIYITLPIGRLGNHLIIIANGIYLAKKYNLPLIHLDNLFSFDKWINVSTGKIGNSSMEVINKPEKDINLKTLSGYMTFHISNYLGGGINSYIDYNYYKQIFQYYFPVISRNLLTKINIDSYNYEKTLFTHLRYTDNMKKDSHYKYNIMPVQLYIYMMNRFNFRTLVVVTDNPKNEYLNELEKQLAKLNKNIKLIIKHSRNNIWEDFKILVEAKYLLMDLSTFTWTAHLISMKKQVVFVWEQFFTRFLRAYRNYVDITIFNTDVLRNNYNTFKMVDYIDCGEWHSSKEEHELTFNWPYTKLEWLDPEVMVDVEKIQFINSISDEDKDKIERENKDKEKLQLELQRTKNMENINKICLIGPGIMEIPPKGWGAVEILIWDYYQNLKKLGWDVDIINIPDRNEIINKVNSGGYCFAHLHYDMFYDILDKLNVPHIAITSHYPYIDKLEKHGKDGYSIVFDFLIKQDKYWNFVLAEKDKKIFVQYGASAKNIKLLKNGASETSFKCIKDINNNMISKDMSICLGKITARKRQTFLLDINNNFDSNVNIYFAGNKEDMSFDYGSKYYLGEWKKEQVYEELTKFANLVLLSNGEADPLVVKEALMAGCGVVVSESSSAYLDGNLPWIDIIPNDKENDRSYIRDIIIKNRNSSIKLRKEIREYAENNFGYTKTVKDYSLWLKLNTRKKPMIVLVGTGTSDIPAKGWGAVEGIVWEYYNQLKTLGFDIKIVNRNDGNIAKMVMSVNEYNPDIVHIFYDDRIDMVPQLKCKKIFYTSHWAYLPQLKTNMKYQADRYFNNVFKLALAFSNKVKFLTISQEIADIYASYNVSKDNLVVINNGASSESFSFDSSCVHPDRALYLAKIDYRKRQYLFQGIESIWYAGNIADDRFDKTKNYLGEWSREQVYSHLTDYASVILLSDGEADPLTVKEAFMAGCGVVVSEYSCANLDLTKPWITVIPESKINDIEYIENKVSENMKTSVSMRNEIRKYGLSFSWNKIIYEKYLDLIF